MYEDNEGDLLKEQDSFETKFEFIYKIKITEISLRELLMVDSIYNCQTTSDISALVQLQPTPTFFFKTFLELDNRCMI